MADGVSKDKLYPLDADRAFKSLDRIKPHIAGGWKKGAQPPQLLTDKEADLGSSWNGRITGEKWKGAAMDVEWNQGIAQYQYYNIPKGAPNRDNALKFIDFAIKPERQARSAELIPYGPTNRKAIALIDKKKAPDLPTYPENLKRQAPFNEEWWLKNEEALINRGAGGRAAATPPTPPRGAGGGRRGARRPPPARVGASGCSGCFCRRWRSWPS